MPAGLVRYNIFALSRLTLLHHSGSQDSPPRNDALNPCRGRDILHDLEMAVGLQMEGLRMLSFARLTGEEDKRYLHRD